MPLVVCATPIGNLADVTLRVLEELGNADLILAEDTRHTRLLLDRHGIATRLLSSHEHNEARRIAELLPRLEAGERIALVSDAGMPGISDPGAPVVRAALAAGISVTVLPGPSAVETALVASGLVGERYLFLGFLPRKKVELDALWRELEPMRWPAVAFESPRRLPASLASLASHSPARPLAVCRELTKHFEEIVRGTAAEVSARYVEPPKGEVTLVIGPDLSATSEEGAVSAAEAGAAVERLVGAGTPRKVAAEVVSSLTGVSRNELYRSSL